MSYFDNIDETEANLNNTSLKHILINNHIGVANKGKIVGQLPLEHILVSVKHSKKLQKD